MGNTVAFGIRGDAKLRRISCGNVGRGRTARRLQPPTVTLDAVLPLIENDLARSDILFRSLKSRATGIGTLWVVTPNEQRSAIEDHLRRCPPEFAAWRVVGETDIVPELALIRPRGWYRQQLIKLAIAEHVESSTYLTLDADVICTRDFSARDLSPDGKPLCYIIPNDWHPDWYRGSVAILGLSSPRRGILHNVTPAVLSRDAVLGLRDHLERRLLCSGLRGVKQRLALHRGRVTEHSTFSRWRLLLAGGTPWTEYSLYYTYLEATGQFTKYHTLATHPIYDIDRSIWYAGRPSIQRWNPSMCFEGAGPPWFVVVQSHTRIPTPEVWRKVEGFLA